MTTDYLTRAQIMQERADRLCDEGHRTTDLDRLMAINAEMELVLKGMRDLREQQLAELVEENERDHQRKKPWWVPRGLARGRYQL